LEFFFFVLDNDEIASLAAGMGIVIPKENFDIINIMRDLENARKALNKVENAPYQDISDELSPVDEIREIEIPMLEWYENDSEAEHFTMVQSRKEKGKNLMENSSRETLVRRSKRTTPIYRDRGAGNSYLQIDKIPK
jgi:hypothetical protein